MRVHFSEGPSVRGEGGGLNKEGDATHIPAGARVVVHTLFGATYRRTRASMADFFYTESMELSGDQNPYPVSLTVRNLLSVAYETQGLAYGACFS